MKEIFVGAALTGVIGLLGFGGKLIAGLLRDIKEELQKVTGVNIEHEQRIRTLEDGRKDHEQRIREIEKGI